MRALILIVVVLAIGCVALLRPLFGMYSYIWFALMRPDLLAYSDGSFPFSMIIAVTTALGSIRFYPKFVRLLSNPICLVLLTLLIPLTLSVFWAQTPAYSWPAFALFARAVAMALLIPVFVATLMELKQLLILMGVSLGVIGTKFGLFGLLAGGVRFSEGFGGMLSDNNDLALALAMSIPPMWFLRSAVPYFWGRALMLGMTFSTMAAIVMTYSRGGAVTLAVVVMLIILRSKRRIGALVMTTLLVVPALYLVGNSYQERMSTIMDPTSEASANSRLELSKAAFEMWLDYPLIGVGFGGGNFARMSEQYTTVQNGSVAHNTYMQMLVDSGIFALILYLILLWGTIAWLGLSIRRTRRDLPDLTNYPVAIQASLIAFAVGCAFLSRVGLDITYLYLMAAASWWAVARRERALLTSQDEIVMLGAGEGQPQQFLSAL